MMSHMTAEDLKYFCREKKPVYWHSDWIKVRKFIGEDFFSAGNKIYIIRVWEDDLHPDEVGVSYIYNKRPGYIALNRDGTSLSKELSYPVFAKE